MSLCNDQCLAVLVAQKLLCFNFLGLHKCGICKTLHDGISYGALPMCTTFSDLDHISRSWQCQTVLTENLCAYLIKLTLCRVVKYVK